MKTFKAHPWPPIPSLTLLLVATLLSGCVTRGPSVDVVRIGDTCYETHSSPSMFGPYTKWTVAYPVGQTNLQKLIQFDSNVGPGGALFGSALRAAGFVGGMHQVRNVGRDQNRVSFNGGNTSVSGGSVTGGTTTISGGNQTVQAPGSR